MEKQLVDELWTIAWKLGIVEKLETLELLRREDSRDKIDGVFHGAHDLPISDWDLPVDRSWDCERLDVRAVAGKDDSNSSDSRGPKFWQGQFFRDIQIAGSKNDHKAERIEVHAVMSSSLSNLTRYRSALKRDFYRAAEFLRKVQGERREREKQQHEQVQEPDSER